MLKLWIKGDKELELEVSDASVEATNHAIVQAFELFGASKEVATTVEAPKVEKVEAPVSTTPAVSYVEPPRPVYKTHHVTNDTATKASNMNQAVQELDKKDVPEHIKTGIKMKMGKPAYRCRYQCPKCKAKSNHYIWPNTSKVDCHTCQTSMVVTKAVKGVALMPDKNNNFYVAGEQLAVIDLTYANQKEKIEILKKNNMLDKDFKGNV
jgi:hypothetical protein